MQTSYHHGNLRRALLDAAIELATARGGFDFTMRELARTADVTHNAPYRHFADKASLLAALAEEGFAMLKARCARERERACSGPADVVRALGRGYVEFAVENPHRFRLMFGETAAAARAEGSSLDAAGRESFGELERAIDACAAAGLLREGIKPSEATLAAWSFVHGFASLIVSGQLTKLGTVAARDRHVTALAAVFLHGALRA